MHSTSNAASEPHPLALRPLRDEFEISIHVACLPGEQHYTAYVSCRGAMAYGTFPDLGEAQKALPRLRAQAREAAKVVTWEMGGAA